MNTALILDSLPRLLHGAILTVELTLCALLAGSILSLPLGFMRASRSKALSWPIFIYSFVFRGTPLLVQIFLIYYGLGQLAFIRESVLWMVFREPFCCALVAFSLNTAAYMTEILRGAIRAVPIREIEAAHAVGMSRLLLARRIILPNAIRISLPAYANEAVLMLKASSLASTITLLEITGMARKLVAETFAPIEVFLSAAVIYFALTWLIAWGFRALEDRLSRSRRQAMPTFAAAGNDHFTSKLFGDWKY